MPELPEVESTARYLHARVAGRTIVKVVLRWERWVNTHAAAEFSRLLVGRTLAAVSRRGKFLVFHLSSGPEQLFAHLRMSGSFDVLGGDIPHDRHDHVIFSLSDGKELRFNDPRKFGRFYLSPEPETVIGKLGIEPLGEDFTVMRFCEILSGQRARIKPFLLRQDRIAGLGNIYVDEALWYARINPRRRAETVTRAEAALLHKGIRKILAEAIQKAGTDFGDGVVDGGGYAPRVYAREGQRCKRCATMIKKIFLAQRGTHFCPKCQRSPRL